MNMIISWFAIIPIVAGIAITILTVYALILAITALRIYINKNR